MIQPIASISFPQTYNIESCNFEKTQILLNQKFTIHNKHGNESNLFCLHDLIQYLHDPIFFIKGSTVNKLRQISKKEASEQLKKEKDIDIQINVTHESQIETLKEKLYFFILLITKSNKSIKNNRYLHFKNKPTLL